MKKILITTDLSRESELAFSLAKDLARKFDSTIGLLMVVEDPAQAIVSYGADPMIYPYPAILQDVVKKVKVDLAKLKETHFPSTECTIHVVETLRSIDTEIVEFAAKENYDTIIMSSHGRTGISRLLLGSVTERVLRHATCPVVVVPVRK